MQAYSQCNISASYSYTTQGSRVSFAGTSTPGGPGQYTWYFGDGKISYGQNVQHTYTEPGSYSVCLKYLSLDSTRKNPCTTTYCDSVTIVGCNFQPSFTDSILGNTVHFSGNVLPYEPGFYTWYFGDGNTAFGKNVLHEYSAPGNYAVCLKYQSYNSRSNGDTCYKYFCDSITIEGCNIQASFSKNLQGKNATFAGNNSSNEEGIYTWNFGDGNTAHGQRTQHHYSNPGTYIVCMSYQSFNTLSNGDTCSASVCDTITIEGCKLEGSFTHHTIGNNVALSGSCTPNGPGIFTWYFGDGNTATGQFTQHHYSSPGVYVVCMDFQSFDSLFIQDSCSAYVCDTIIIESCTIEASFTNNTFGKTATFAGSNSSNEPGIYKWNFGDGSFDFGQNAQHSYSNPGTYAVCMTYQSFNPLSNGDTCFASVCDSITIEGCNLEGSFTHHISGSNVSLTGSCTPNGPGIFTWYFGDGNTATGQFTQHHYSAPGVYPVCMSFQSFDSLSIGDSCFAYACDTIVIEGCNIQASFTNTTKGKTVAFSGSSSPNEPGIYRWNFGDGKVKFGQNIQHTYTESGNYNVCMTFQSFKTFSGIDTCFATFCDTIVIAGCNSGISFKDSLVGKTVYLTGLTTPLKAGTYEWTLGDGKKRTGKKITYEYANSGTYTICVKFKSQDGLCNIQTCKTITIRKCYVDVRFTKAVSKDTARFTAVSSPDLPGTYYWNFGDGVIGSGKTATHMYATSGNYPVTLSFYSEDSECICEAVYTDTVKVKVCPKATFTQFSNGKTVTFSAYSNTIESGTYYWNFGDGTYGIGQTVSHTYSNLSNYTATMEFYSHHGFCKCLCKASFSSRVNFESCDTISFITQTNGNFAYFNAYPTATGIFQWNFGDGSSTITYSSSTSHYYNNAGNYPVELTSILMSEDRMDTCISSSSDSIYIYGDSSSTLAKEAILAIYPMPASDKVNYSIENNPSATISSVEIIDPMGIVMKKEENISSNTNSIDVNKLATGLYIIKIISGDKVYSQTFLKD